MAKRKRDIMLRFFVTEHERDLIMQKMEQVGTDNMSAYLRKMAIDGYILLNDRQEIRELTSAISAAGKNINQIARRVNSTTDIYDEDIREIKEKVEEIWQRQKQFLCGKA